MELIKGTDGQPFGPLINAGGLFWLPTDTPFGNLTLKLLKLAMRLGHANKRLAESARGWGDLAAGQFSSPNNSAADHWYAAEEAVFMIRRAADELVATLWLLETRLKEGEYPTKLGVDSVGRALAGEDALWTRHERLLRTLNDLANAHKHSFVHSDMNVAGAEQPCVVALALPWNDATREPELYVVSLEFLVRSFNSFLTECLGHLQALAARLPEHP